ncbi:hypothetical protein [Allocoleopsis sp.]|uniref:hypothetical protein n=1 Tax=Allocoleopsis sp. TaxID=3088169 RepID=UPI002FCF2658
MSQNKFHNNSSIRDKSLNFLNYLGLWSQCGIDWSLTIKEEIQDAVDQPIEEKKPKLTKKVVRFSALTTLVLLGAGIWIQAPKIYQAAQEVGRNSVEQLNAQIKQKIGGNY